MTPALLTSSPKDLDSTSAISARAKEKIRMQAQRYQRGSLSIMKRKRQPDAWVFRYYGKTIDLEYRVKSVDRGWRWVRSRGSPRVGPKGQIVRWYGSVEDIDERRQLEEAQRKDVA